MLSTHSTGQVKLGKRQGKLGYPTTFLWACFNAIRAYGLVKST
jgi:hypothetical protein